MLEFILTTHRHLLRLPRAGMAISEVHPSTCVSQPALSAGPVHAAGQIKFANLNARLLVDRLRSSLVVRTAAIFSSGCERVRRVHLRQVDLRDGSDLYQPVGAGVCTSDEGGGVPKMAATSATATQTDASRTLAWAKALAKPGVVVHRESDPPQLAVAIAWSTMLLHIATQWAWS